MSEMLDEVTIANSLGLTEEIVHKVINGQFDLDADLEEDQPIKSESKVKVLERAKFVRNKTVAAISTGGGNGKSTILTSLSLCSALYNPNRRPIAIVDFNQVPKVMSMVGLNPVKLMNKNEFVISAAVWPNMGIVGQNQIFEAYMNSHDVLENLYVLPGVVSTKQYDKIDIKKMLDIVTTLQKYCETVFLDLPNDFILYEDLYELCDFIVFVANCNYYSLEGLSQMKTALEDKPWSDLLIPVLNNVGNGLSPERCRQILFKEFELDITFEAFIPYVREFKEYDKFEDPHILKEPDSNFSQEIKNIVNTINPDWNLSSKEKPSGGLKGLIDRLIK